MWTSKAYFNPKALNFLWCDDLTDGDVEYMPQEEVKVVADAGV